MTNGQRITLPRWKTLIVRMFGEEVMSTNTARIYKFRGILMSLNKQEYSEKKEMAIVFFLFMLSVVVPVFLLIWLVMQ